MSAARVRRHEPDPPTQQFAAWLKAQAKLPFEARLLDILREGGPRKLSIVKAWASWAGFRLEEAHHRIQVMKRSGDLVERPHIGKPFQDGSCTGPWLELGKGA